MKTSRWSCAAVVAAVVWGASGLPIASAQTAPPPGPPSGQVLPPSQTPPPAQMQPMPTPITTAPYEPTQGDRIGAGALNIVYVPGKVIVCGAGVLASSLTMLLTFGSSYDRAIGFFQEGCGGKWALTPYDVAGRRPPEDM